MCELFTSKDISFVPIGRIVKTGGMRAVRDYYENLGAEYVDALNDMIVFDAVIYNTDRHFGNFGVLVDSRLKDKLRRLLTYNLQKAGVYNYPADRLRLISKMIQERVHQI